MAAFTIHRTTGAPLVRIGTNSADNFTTVGVLGLLAPGLSQDALGGFDTLTLRGLGPLTVGDAAFAGLRNFERLDIASFHPTTITLGTAAALAFGGVMEIRAFQGKLTLDGSALTSATRLVVLGGNAGDALTGGAGDDSILGRVGDDTLVGGAGRDTLRGGADQDDLSGGEGDDSLFGEGGQDSLDGGAGRDRLGGGAGEDLLAGGAGQDTLLGDAGNDTLRGDGDADTLRGGEGLDLLDGGAGDDLLEGGLGADVFRISGGVDFISDFSEAEGDRLDVSGLEIRTLAQFQGIATQIGNTVRLDTGAGEITRLHNVTLAELEADDLILAPGRAPTDIGFAFAPRIITGSSNGGLGLTGVGILTATDPDLGDTLTFSVDDPRFAIAFNGFLWVTGTPFDFAVQESVTLTITVTDSFGLSYSEEFTIPVSEPSLTTDNLLISENLAVGALVGLWAPVDFVPVGEVTFELVTPGAPFAFEDNVLVATETLDFEARASYDLTVRMRDSGADPDDAADDRVVLRNVTVTVEDREEESLVLLVERHGPESLTPGEAVDLTLFDVGDSVRGTILPDEVSLIGSATAGQGSAGLDGSGGGDGLESFLFGTPLNTRTVADGADGMDGAAPILDGGLATARAGNLSLALGNFPDALGDDLFRLDITARGGAARGGGDGGAGGDSAFQSSHTDLDAGTGQVLGGVFDSTGQGGTGGDGGAGGAGGAAQSYLVGLNASFMAHAALTLVSTALGGAGGRGGAGGDGGIGAFDADLTTAGDGGEGGTGGAGGRGGDAISLIAAAGGGFGGGDLGFTVVSTARGGQGGQGGAGGAAGRNQTSISETQVGAETITIAEVTTGHDIAGDGGRGGDGGDAEALINDLRIGNYVSFPTSTTVRLQAEATGGLGGAGGLGSTEIGTNGTASDGSLTEISVAGIAGADGAAGTQGVARITIAINHIYLDAGDDVLQISAFFNGSSHELSFVGNVFDGGAGNDYFDLSGFYGFGVTLDIAQDRMTFEGNPWSTLTGFERFRGTEGDDLFIDGAGSQVYEGGSGQDLYVFAPGHGNDSIRDFTQGQDRIDFSAFAEVGFDDLLIIYGGAGTPDNPAYVVISANGGTNSVGFNLTEPLTLLASDFLFA